METTGKQRKTISRRRTPSGPADVGRPTLANRIWYCLSQRTLQLLWVLLYRVRRWGVENIPAEGPVLLTANHQSHFDSPLMGCCCPRRMGHVARASLFKFGPFALLIRSFGAIPIERDGGGFAGIRETLRRLKRGEVVVIFPEGARTRDGRIAPFRPGIRTLATRSGATIVPVAIEGAFRAWPRSRGLPRAGRIHVRFGRPLSPEEVQRLGEDALVAEVERRIRRYHAELCGHPVFTGHGTGRSGGE